MLNTALVVGLLMRAGAILVAAGEVGGGVADVAPMMMGGLLLAALCAGRALRFVWFTWGIPWLARVGDEGIEFAG